MYDLCFQKTNNSFLQFFDIFFAVDCLNDCVWLLY